MTGFCPVFHGAFQCSSVKEKQFILVEHAGDYTAGYQSSGQRSILDVGYFVPATEAELNH